MLTILAMILGTIIVAGMIVGLITFGVGVLVTVFVYAIKLGIVLIPLAIAYVLIRNLFIW